MRRSSDPDRSALEVRWLGRIPYERALAAMEARVNSRRRGDVPDALWLLEHPPVITLGRNSRPEHLLAKPEALAARGIGVHEAGRGGDVTYHGPGQLVGYPILALPPDQRDAHRYLRRLEGVLMEALAKEGIEARRVPGLTGLWVEDRKIAAIGVRLHRGWITSHGFSLNVHGELEGFRWIVPCGIRHRAVTSIEAETGRRMEVRAVAGRVAEAFAAEFGGTPANDAGPTPRGRLAAAPARWDCVGTKG